MAGTVYDDSLANGSVAMPSPRTSPFPSDYPAVPDYINSSYAPMQEGCDTWGSAPGINPGLSDHPSPCSSANTEDYSGASASYMHSNMATNAMMHATSVHSDDGHYDEVDGTGKHIRFKPALPRILIIRL